MDAEKYLQNALKIIIEKEGLKNVQIEYEDVIKGGYMSDAKTINIKQHDNTVLSLFSKRLPNPCNEVTKLVFTNESNFYQNVLPELKKLDVTVSSFIPKCYYVDAELIILENLHASGMKVWDDLKIPLDEEHMVVVLKQYGKFHALSAALKSRFPELFHRISKKFDPLKFALTKVEGVKYRQSLGRKVSAAFGAGERNCAEALMAFLEDDIYNFLTDMYDDKEHDVIVHGDCWPHNFFFKYEESQISKIYLIDFQLSFIASPIIDLSYFLCTSGCSKQYFDGIERYLKLYHDSFHAEMRKQGFESRQIVPFTTLVDQWRKHGKYGLIMGMVINKMLIADKDELLANQSEDILLSFDFVSRNEDLYHQRIRDCVSYFYENDML